MDAIEGSVALCSEFGDDRTRLFAGDANFWVVPGALYRRVRSQEQLQDLVVDGVLAEIDCDVSCALPWTEPRISVNEQRVQDAVTRKQHYQFSGRFQVTAFPL